MRTQLVTEDACIPGPRCPVGALRLGIAKRLTNIPIATGSDGTIVNGAPSLAAVKILKQF